MNNSSNRPEFYFSRHTLSLFLLYLLFATAVLTTVSADRAVAEQECPAGSILLGMSTALTGPASHLGINMRDGVMAALHEANNSSFDPDHKLCLVTLDDGYEPERTGPNVKSLINDHQVLALIGNVGTPTAVVTIPLVNQYKTLLFGAYTGAGILRKNPPDRYVINYRASYGEETASIVEALIDIAGLRTEEIAFFTQRDAYGDAGFHGGLTAMKKYGLTETRHIVHGSYERNTMDIENGLADIILAEPPPKAVIMVGSYAPCAKFIKLAKKNGLNDILFINVSFVGPTPLLNELGEAGEGVIITQVVPNYNNADLPVIKDYHLALSAYDEGLIPTFGSLEGYITTRIFLLGLARAPRPVDREKIIDSLEGLNHFDIGLGHELHLSAKEHQASHRVWPTIIHQGQVLPYNWEQLRNSRQFGNDE